MLSIRERSSGSSEWILLEEQLGLVDILVNNAGITRPQLRLEMTEGTGIGIWTFM